MEPMTKTRLNPETGEQEVIPLTAQEIAQRAIDAASEPEVTSITKLQRNLWLATKGLYNQATTWINKPDEQTLIRQIYWRDAETTKIDDPITIALAEELGLKTREQRVAAFREASKIG